MQQVGSANVIVRQSSKQLPGGGWSCVLESLIHLAVLRALGTATHEPVCLSVVLLSELGLQVAGEELIFHPFIGSSPEGGIDCLM